MGKGGERVEDALEMPGKCWAYSAWVPVYGAKIVRPPLRRRYFDRVDCEIPSSIF
ncbi:MAG: hypothetical protein RLZZ245_3679 [Verrucomicrobiota bacterium]